MLSLTLNLTPFQELLANSMKGSPNFSANTPIITSLRVFQALEIS